MPPLKIPAQCRCGQKFRSAAEGMVRFFIKATLYPQIILQWSDQILYDRLLVLKMIE